MTKAGMSRWLALVLILVVSTLEVVVREAPALALPSTTLEQHQELLAEHITTAKSTSVSIIRGAVPGGTSQFDPQPTVTLEVVAKHTGGSGSSHYDVALLGAGTFVFGTISFAASDTSYTLKTVAVLASWPSSDKTLQSFQITKVNDGLNLAGTLDIQKAYLKYHQAGTMRKTVSSYPIAVKQTQITSTSWQDVADVVWYKHVAADFDPAPTVSFRTTGVEITANPILQSLFVQLVDASGNVVLNSLHVHSAVGSISSSVTLTDGALYKVQVAVERPGEIGELWSADLVFNQASSASNGIRKTVGWYPGVTSGSDLTTPDTNLGFTFRAPTLSAYRTRAAWAASARLTSGQQAAVGLFDSTLSVLGDIAAVGTSANSFTYIRADAIPATDNVDSRAILPTGAAGHVSVSALKIAIDLIDTDPPIVGLVNPVSGGNTLFTSQPIIAAVSDPILTLDFGGQSGAQGSGVDPASVQVSARNVTTGVVQNLSAQLSGSVIRSAAAQLSPGSQYDITVQASDLAGNQTSTTGRVQAMQSATATVPTVTVASVASSRVSSGQTTDTYYWDSVPVGIASMVITLNATQHVGDGPVAIDISPTPAVVTYSLGGSQHTANVVESDLRTVLEKFTAASTGSVSATVPAGGGQIGTLSAVLPKNASNVTLSMNTSATTTRFLACADPSASSTRCLPDPVATLGRQESVWRPWANLLSADPFAIPAQVGGLVGLALPDNRCTGTPPPLATAIVSLGAAMGQSDSLRTDISIDSTVSSTLAKIVNCADIHLGLLAEYDPNYDGLPSISLRTEWLAAQRDLMSTLQGLPSLTFAGSSAATCIDDQLKCWIQMGGPEATTYTRPAVLSLDTGGPDTYSNNAGGAGKGLGPVLQTGFANGLPIAIAADLGSSDANADGSCPAGYTLNGACGDHYWPANSTGQPTNGAGTEGGVGVLLHQSGNAFYCGLGFSMGAGWGGSGFLLDQSGSDRYESFTGDFTPGDGLSLCPRVKPTGVQRGAVSKVVEGAAEIGSFGFLVDQGAGNDTYYNAGVDSIGHGAEGGVGLLRDDGGNDTYTDDAAFNASIDNCAPSPNPSIAVTCQASSGVSLGTGEVGGGIGVVLDGAGSDTAGCTKTAPGHSSDGFLAYGCLGAGTFGGFGLFYHHGPGSNSFSIARQAGLGDINPDSSSGVGYQGPGAPGGLGSGALGFLTSGGLGLPAGGFFVNEGVAGDSAAYQSTACKSAGYGYVGTGLFLDSGSTDAYSMQCDAWLSVPDGTPRRADNRLWVGESNGSADPELFVTGSGSDSG